MKTATLVGTARRMTARRALSAIVTVGAAFMFVSPVVAQSSDASAAPAVSVAPATEASTPSGLAAIEAGFATQACDPFLSAAELSSIVGVTVTGVSGGLVAPDSDRAGFVGLDCGWSIDGGTVWLKVDEREWRGKGKPKTKDLWDANDRGYSPDQTKLAGPGDAAYSDPGSEQGYYPGHPNVTWSQWVRHGKAFADRWVSLDSDVLDVAALEDVATTVRSGATPSGAPLAAAPGESAMALLGSWTLSSWVGAPFELPNVATVTFTFDDAGMVTSTLDCQRKGEKPLKDTSLYFVEGDKVMTTSDAEGPKGGCAPSGLDAFDHTVLLKVSEPISSADDATWTVDGDTLTITGLNGIAQTLIFERA